jgi:hypothetical protein
VKLRAWNIKEQKYYPWEFLDDDSNVMPNLWKALDSPDGPVWVIEQFTGLHDKNRSDIYEGDILHRHGVVRLGRSAFDSGVYPFIGFYLEDYGDGQDYAGSWIDEEGLEVIGNIHENPELLK